MLSAIKASHACSVCFHHCHHFMDSIRVICKSYVGLLKPDRLHETCVFVQLRWCVQHWNDSLGVLTYSQRVTSLCSSKYYGLTTQEDIPSCFFSVSISPSIVRGLLNTDVSHIWLCYQNFPCMRQNYLIYRIKGQAGLFLSHSTQLNSNVEHCIVAKQL